MYDGGSAIPSSKPPFLLTSGQLRRLSSYFSLSHRVPRVDDRRVVSGIIYVIRHGLLVTIRRIPRLFDLHAVPGAMFCCFFQFQGNNS
jgi:hypothetical protein